jgi:hypothetical protein
MYMRFPSLPVGSIWNYRGGGKPVVMGEISPSSRMDHNSHYRFPSRAEAIRLAIKKPEVVTSYCVPVRLDGYPYS